MTNNIRVHYFRGGGRLDNQGHNLMPGCHGKNPRYCKACVKVVMAEIQTDHGTYVGFAFRNESDQFNRKIGRRIAIGRAQKEMETNGVCFYNPIVKGWIERAYNHDTNGLTLKEFWDTRRLVSAASTPRLLTQD